MQLGEFIENFVEKNSLIRLWNKSESNYKFIDYPLEKEPVFMEHELLKSDLRNFEVIGLKDIYMDKSNYPEAINIVLKENNNYKNGLSIKETNL